MAEAKTFKVPWFLKSNFANTAKFPLAIILLSCYYHIKRVKDNYLNADSKTFLFFILDALTEDVN